MTGVYEGQEVAERLAARLTVEGHECTAAGSGFHWHVDVGHGHRALKIHCFWYGQAAGLMLGMNPGNARMRLGPSRIPYEGAEFLARLLDRGEAIVEGRTRDEGQMSRCVHAWLSGLSLDEVVDLTPFVDAGPRALRLSAANLPDELRASTYSTHDGLLWVYGDRLRACAFDADGACSFRYGQAQLARAETVDVSAATRAWLLARVSIDELPSTVPGAVLERHASWAEVAPARWHWLHLLDRAADPNDALAPLADLIRALSVRPLPTEFFTFSSLSALCFSASSHFPWVDDGLPRIFRARGGGYEFALRMRREAIAIASLDQAIDEIESALRQCRVVPFYGTSEDIAYEALSRELARQGSILVPRLERTGPWSTVVVEQDARKCEVRDRAVSFRGRRIECADDADVARCVEELLRPSEA